MPQHSKATGTGWTGALDLTDGRSGAPPLFLLDDGTFSTTKTAAPAGLEASAALVTAARWISGRRTSTFERLFPPSPFHPERPVRTEHLDATRAGRLLAQLRAALAASAVGGTAARADALEAAELRSAALTVLSHIVATVLADASFRAVADQAAEEIFRLVGAEAGDPTARPALRAHAIFLLQQRGPALTQDGRRRATDLLATLVRAAPPYADMKGPWHFAMCNGDSFHEGECNLLVSAHGFKEVAAPEGSPQAPWNQAYRVFQAPFLTPASQPIFVFARMAEPTDENFEMGSAFFHGTLLNRHAQLGSFDLRATSVNVTQVGYKIMMNSQCAGLTTRFALGRMFPDADLYSSWDSTFFRTAGPDESGPVTASEGQDCWMAMLKGMSQGETHAQLDLRIKASQWQHPQSSHPDFVQFIGPAHALVLARYSDVSDHGHADFYDGFFDFKLVAIAEDLRASATPRDPGVAASQIGGEAGSGLDWAAGSMNRVSQYSDLWVGLPADAEHFYAFQAGGFFSAGEPAADVPVAPLVAVAPTAPARSGQGVPSLVEDLSRLPALCRYAKAPDSAAGLRVEVMMHSWLSHSGKEYKRLLCAAEAIWRGLDVGYLPGSGPLATLAARRGAVLLTLAGLLEFPADQNFIDGLWSFALAELGLPDISRSVVRRCISEADHAADNYYGSVRGLEQLLGAGGGKGDLEKSDPAAFAALQSPDPNVGRARPLDLKTAPRVA